MAGLYDIEKRKGMLNNKKRLQLFSSFSLSLILWYLNIKSYDGVDT